ncbi:hypothetical protein CFN78_06675 [Amycolatopsis antarctica]|uniref:Uncharacterized protein n=1 Tax=Amycolatopsis antarctica TaxID=1854586 RepID=A0A263D912_9PSEU|nr:hypothetical protein [Amycolatopsis antarctica]OZM73966.1 hypothetical protein CFN78_06675 [Amycolatopsis antarctica]
MRVVRKPESFEAHEITTVTKVADFEALYRAVVPDGGATIEAAKVGAQWFVTTSEDPSWAGRFQVGDLVCYMAPIFIKLEPVADFVPYADVYVTP